MGVAGQNRVAYIRVREENNRGMNQVDEVGDEENKISLISLDSFLEFKPDLIKIDVEGYEVEVINGGKETLTKYKPKLFIEIDDNNLKWAGSSARELVETLEKLNYQIFNAETSSPVKSEDNFENCHFDIVALPEYKVFVG